MLVQKCNWNVREATLKDFEEIFDRAPDNSVRAWALDVAGELCGLGGVVLVRGVYTAFLQVKKDTQVSKIILVRAMKEGWRKISQMKFVVLYAIKDPKIKSAERLLRAFGFEDEERDTEDGRVYICQAQ